MEKSRVYGYCRISTAKQQINRQIDNIKAFNNEAIILQETFTGTTTTRPVFARLIKQVKTGDTIIFDEVSRMSRNAEEGIEIYQQLYDAGVNLIFLKERHIDTEVFRTAINTQIEKTNNKVVDCVIEGINKAFKELARQQIEIAFQTAQKEVDYLHRRTSEGVKQAQLRYQQEEIEGRDHQKKLPGQQKGHKLITKKSIEMKEMIKELSKCFKGSWNDTKVIDHLGIDRHTYYKYKKELLEEAQRAAF